MEAEMREQPDLLVARWPGYNARLREFLEGKSFDLVLLVARGSSDNAALFARYLIEIFAGLPVSLAAPSVFTRYEASPRYPKTLVIGISQSGAAPDVAEVLEAMRAQGHATLAITNTSHSHISESAACTLMLELGAESAVAATKTYTASLLALYAVAAALGNVLREPKLPDADWLETARAAAENGLHKFERAQNFFALARGIRFCSAQEAALKLMECALLPCHAYSMADFQHGPRALTTIDSAAIVFGESPAAWDDETFKLLNAPKHAEVPEASLPLWDAFFAQWLALLAARERGLDPDEPEGLSKVTKTL